MSDLDASQVVIPELDNVYLHNGFYKYSSTFFKLINDDIKENHRIKDFYFCGHSLGGAGALIISSLVVNNYSLSKLVYSHMGCQGQVLIPLLLSLIILSTIVMLIIMIWCHKFHLNG